MSSLLPPRPERALALATSVALTLGALLAACVLAACDPGVRIGTACEYTSECPAPLVCGFGRCRAECRQNVDCPLGALCRLEGGLDGAPAIGSCELPDDPRCNELSCPLGSICVEHRCVNRCGSCAEGNVCATTERGDPICVDPRTEPDAGAPRDAGTDGGSDSGTDAGDGGAAQCHGPACDAIAAIAMEAGHACALTRDGAVWCWGRDESGESSGTSEGAPRCGALAIPCRPEPVRIELAARAVEVGAGLGFSCARLADGRVQCWGGNSDGQLGRPVSLAPPPAPFVVVDEPGRQIDASLLAVGRCHALVARADGAWGWGCNGAQQLGDADPSRAFATPAGADRAVPGALAGGGFFSCALTSGQVSCWGSNQHGQLGRGLVGASSATAQPVAGPIADLVATELALGAEHACALASAGSAGGGSAEGDAWCWGNADLVGPDVASPELVVTHDGARFSAIATSPTGHAICGITAARDEIRCWGSADGDLSLYPDGLSRHDQPTTVASGGPFADVAVTSATGCALTDDGELLCWGDNELGTRGLGHDDPAGSALVPVVWPWPE